MTDETGGYRIGIRDVYAQIVELSAKLDKIAGEHTVQIAQLQSAQKTMGDAMREMWHRIEKEQVHLATHEREADLKRIQHAKEVNEELERRGEKSWQSFLAIAAIVVSAVTALLQILVK